MKTIVTAALFLLSSFAFADSLDSRKETRDLSDQMVSHFVKREFSDALSLAKPHWPIPAVEIDGLANQISNQWPIVDNRFGEAIGSEFVREERIGNSFTRYYYLHKFSNHAIYWQITFYRPNESWKVNSVTFKDDLGVLFEPAKDQ